MRVSQGVRVKLQAACLHIGISAGRVSQSILLAGCLAHDKHDESLSLPKPQHPRHLKQASPQIATLNSNTPVPLINSLMPELETAQSSSNNNTSARPPRGPRNRRGRGGGTASHAAAGHATGCSDAPNGPSGSSNGQLLDPSAASFAPPTGPARRGGRGRGGGGAAQNGRGRGRGGAARGGGAAGRNAAATSQAEGSSNGAVAPTDEAAAVASSQPAQGGRRGKFGGKITKSTDREAIAPTTTATAAPPAKPIEYADLRSRLVAELSSGAYDCSVCYSVIGVRAHIWSCTSCHTVLHLKCAHTWAEGSVRKSEEQNAMQEDAAMRARKGTWRCPGCQYAREEVPQSYKCWDGQVTDPAGGKGAPPHSCARPCAKAKCKHGCPAGVCHPGPCPPCAVTTLHRCFCGSQEIATRCSQLSSKPPASLDGTLGSLTNGISCDSTCGNTLSCGVHKCEKLCHPGDCGACEVRVAAKCYCGKAERETRCGEGVKKISTGQDGASWEGTWTCERECLKLFDCGKHACKKSCHPLEPETAVCPFSPARVSTCPCGAEPAGERTSCEDPVATCGRPCSKPLACGHSCTQLCHTGECKPCSVPVSSPCRCGETKITLTCSVRQREEKEGQQEVLCQTRCRSLRHCGKHECGRTCCPLYFQAKSKAKRRPTHAELEAQDIAGLHSCDVPCQKPLSCGRHQCPIGCHRGPCPPCLQASFEELICHCGRTILDPPVPCGTTIQCNFPCTRAPPACGHPKQQHNCHESEQCPPCVYLVTKPCLCGKNLVENVPCHRVRVSCGTTCNAVLNCGYHLCPATCHAAGECAPCAQVCGKPRRCGHACPMPCHAPAACDETQPCEAHITIMCACGNLQQRAVCGGSAQAQPGERKLKCTDACTLAQRNARLAEALGLNPADKVVPAAEYDAAMLTYYGHNRRSCDEVEASLIDFIQSSRHALILPAANKNQREFEVQLATRHFGLLAEETFDDMEARRSVVVRRRQTCRVPKPLLSQAFKATAASRNARPATALGQLRRGPEAPKHALNAVLLERVFGHDSASLRALLSQRIPLLRSVPLIARWIGDEDVLLLAEAPGRPVTLVSATAQLKALARSDSFATNVVAVSVDSTGRILRRDDGPLTNTAGSAPSSAPGSGASTPRTGLGGWAAVASGAVHHSAAAPPRPSAWGAPIAAARPAPAPVAPALAPLPTHRIPAVPSVAAPDDWDAED